MEGALEIKPGLVARPRALDAATMAEAFQQTAADRADQVALRTLGDAVSITFAEYGERVRRFAGAFHGLGIRRGDTVGFMLSNRPEFHLLDTAAMHLGATPFSIYNTSSAEQIAYLLGDARNRVMVVEAALLERVREAIAAAGTVEHMIVLDAVDTGDAGSFSLTEFESVPPGGDFDFEAAWRAIQPTDVLTLIYTSGTTGPPKGVQLTHANELAECRALDAAGEWHGTGGSIVSYLPVAHIADRGLVHYAQMIWGHEITTCPDVTQVFAHAIDARPTRFGGVPRVWEKLKAALEARLATEPDEARRQATLDAVALGIRKVRLEQAGERVPAEMLEAYERAEAAIFSKIRAGLGFDRCEAYMIGAAPAPLEIFEFFAAIGIPICEVWGMSELSCVATLVPREKIRFGTVGPPLPGVEITLADDGEVLVRGEIVMAGYRNQPDKTAETIDPDGWLHTGDIGAFDEHGYLKIVDRKKELIINAAGKNMSPANIEQQLKQGSPLIGQAVAIGDSRPYNVALIVLDPDAAAAFAAHHGASDISAAALAAHPAIHAAVDTAVNAGNGKLSRVEQIKRFTILPAFWEPGGDEITPTMKLKRRLIAAKYAEVIDAMYATAAQPG